MAARPAPTAQPPGAALSRFVTIFMVMLAVVVLLDNDLRAALGTLVGYGLQPLIGFDYQYPVITLFLAGMVMTGLTVIVRHFFTNYVEQAENQKIVSAFNKELRQARLENNTFKMKKLMEQQQQIMQRSLKSSATQLKLMPVTMIIIVPIFAWIAVFMVNVPSAIVAVPWSYSVDLNAYTVFPNWVLLYSVASLPFGQVLSRLLRWSDFRKRLREIEAAGLA
jgi:uncharacterized membrane protein (DUF106 family)